MSMYRAKKLDLGGFVNIKVIRDHTKRKVFAKNEPERYDSSTLNKPRNVNGLIRVIVSFAKCISICRQALRYIIRNMTLPARTRAQAQLQLTQMHCYTRPTQIRNRCVEGGKGRGVLRDFKMSRVCHYRDPHYSFMAKSISTEY